MGSPPTCTHSLVNITSRKIIRPLSPTPHHQRTLNLSLLDQLFPPTLYPTIIYIYSIDHFPSNNVSESLQTSLSKALVYFYPLAGRLNGPASIDCNDEGAYFLEAQVNCQLSDLLKLPEHSLLNNLIPEFDPQTAHSAIGSAVLLVQMSRFNCGGIALAVSLSHKIADATSCQTFVRAWAAIHRDHKYDTQLMVPQFNGSSLLPAKDSFLNNLGLPKYQSLTTRRFVFEVTKIANLKAKIGGTYKRTTCFSDHLEKCSCCFLSIQAGDEFKCSSVVANGKYPQKYGFGSTGKCHGKLVLATSSGIQTKRDGTT